jgi:iron complex outermembrane receptor protein
MGANSHRKFDLFPMALARSATSSAFITRTARRIAGSDASLSGRALNFGILKQERRARPLFAQATYNITPSTHVDAGIRFNREKISVEFTDLRPNATAATCRLTCVGDAQDDQVTYKVALRQDLSKDIMAYASYATGYKGQGFDVTSGFTQARADNPVRPEHSKAYEVGLKGAFLDNKVQLNLAGFWTDYKDFQTQIASFANGIVTLNLANAPKLRSRGVEADFSARPIRALRIDGAASFVDAKILEFPGGGCYPAQPFVVGTVATERGICVGPTPASGTQNLAGARLANAPRFKYSISANYEVILPTLPFNGFIQADWVHQSSVNFDIGGNPRAFQEGYGILNGSVGIEGSNDKRFRVAFFVNNLLNKQYATAITPASGSNSDPGVNNVNIATNQFLPRDSRRYVGLRARVRY